MKSAVKDLMALDDVIQGMRKIVEPKERTTPDVELSTVENRDLSALFLKQGEWTRSPYPGMRWMLAREAEDIGSKYILCEVTGPLDLGAHRHPNHVEEIILYEGVMKDKLLGKTVLVGGRIKYPPGQAHWPIFEGPASFMRIIR